MADRRRILGWLACGSTGRKGASAAAIAEAEAEAAAEADAQPEREGTTAACFRPPSSSSSSSSLSAPRASSTGGAYGALALTYAITSSSGGGGPGLHSASGQAGSGSGGSQAGAALAALSPPAARVAAAEPLSAAALAGPLPWSRLRAAYSVADLSLGPIFSAAPSLLPCPPSSLCPAALVDVNSGGAVLVLVFAPAPPQPQPQPHPKQPHPKQLSNLHRQHQQHHRLEQKERLAVIKLTPTRLAAQAELLASELAANLGAPTPAARLMRRPSPEWDAALRAADALVAQQQQLRRQQRRLFSSPLASGSVSGNGSGNGGSSSGGGGVSAGASPSLSAELRAPACPPVALLFEFCVGTPLGRCPRAAVAAAAVAGAAAPGCLPRDAGAVLALDLLLDNADRFALRALGWRGNPGNALVVGCGGGGGVRSDDTGALPMPPPPPARLVAIDACVPRCRVSARQGALRDAPAAERVAQLCVADRVFAATVLRRALALPRSLPLSAGGAVAAEAGGGASAAASFQEGLRAAFARADSVTGLLETAEGALRGWLRAFAEDVLAVLPAGEQRSQLAAGILASASSSPTACSSTPQHKQQQQRTQQQRRRSPPPRSPLPSPGRTAALARSAAPLPPPTDQRDLTLLCGGRQAAPPLAPARQQTTARSPTATTASLPPSPLPPLTAASLAAITAEARRSPRIAAVLAAWQDRLRRKLGGLAGAAHDWSERRAAVAGGDGGGAACTSDALPSSPPPPPMLESYLAPYRAAADPAGDGAAAAATPSPLVDAHDLASRLAHLLRRARLLASAASARLPDEVPLPPLLPPRLLLPLEPPRAAAAPTAPLPVGRLFVGDAVSADCHHALRRLGVRRVLCCAAELPWPPSALPPLASAARLALVDGGPRLLALHKPRQQHPRQQQERQQQSAAAAAAAAVAAVTAASAAQGLLMERFDAAVEWIDEALVLAAAEDATSDDDADDDDNDSGGTDESGGEDNSDDGGRPPGGRRAGRSGQKRAGGAVLVHCSEGRSRSVSVVAAFLVAKHGLDPAAAVAAVRSARPSVAPHPFFVAGLEAYARRQMRASSPSRPDADAVATVLAAEPSSCPPAGDKAP